MSTPEERFDIIKPYIYVGAELHATVRKIPNFSHMLAGARFADNVI